MKKNKSIRVLLGSIAFAILVVVSCSKDKFGGDNAPTLSANDYKLTIHYDAESTVTRQVVNQADASRLTDYDKIAAIPFVNRVEVQMGIKADGTSDWVITKKEPQYPLKRVSQAPADPTPKTVTLKVSNNKLTTYDVAAAADATIKATNLSAGRSATNRSNDIGIGHSMGGLTVR